MQYLETTATQKVKSLTKKIRAIQGGTSASKTISVLLYLIALSQTDSPEDPKLTSIVSESMPHLKRGAIRDFKSILKQHGYWKKGSWNASDYIYTFETGSQIEFFSADQGDKLRGARRDRGFMNEANNCSFDSFDQFEVRTRQFVLLDWNPTNEFWYYTDVEPLRTDVERIILTYKDNEALDEATVASIEQRKNRPGWWKVYGQGQLGEVEGKIYTGWTIIDDIPEEARYIRTGMDYGYANDPTAAVDMWKWNDAIVLDELMFTKGLSNKQIADTLLTDSNRFTVADSAEPKSNDEIRGYGAKIIGAEKGKDSVSNGIQLVQSQKIFVTKRSVNIIKEYRNYLWETDRDGKIINEPEHTFSHSMDAIRYGISSFAKRSLLAAHQYIPTGSRVTPRTLVIGAPDVQPSMPAIPNRAHQYRPKFKR